MWNSFPSVVNSLAGSLPAVLISTTTLSTEERKEKLNAVKMSVFLLCKLTETLEGHSSRQSIVSAPGKVWIIITHTHTPCWALLMVQSLVLIWLNVLFFFFVLLHRVVKRVKLARVCYSGTRREKGCCRCSFSSFSWISVPSGISPWSRKSLSGTDIEMDVVVSINTDISLICSTTALLYIACSPLKITENQLIHSSPP